MLVLGFLRMFAPLIVGTLGAVVADILVGLAFSAGAWLSSDRGEAPFMSENCSHFSTPRLSTDLRIILWAYSVSCGICRSLPGFSFS